MGDGERQDLQIYGRVGDTEEKPWCEVGERPRESPTDDRAYDKLVLFSITALPSQLPTFTRLFLF